MADSTQQGLLVEVGLADSAWSHAASRAGGGRVAGSKKHRQVRRDTREVCTLLVMSLITLAEKIALLNRSKQR